MFGGRLKVVRFASERSRGGRINRGMQDFSDFIDEMKLMDLPLEGGLFSWFSNRDLPSLSRLDRFLISQGWEAHFPGVVQS